jgi:asparagine synthase (glutamine-hydrolysing)
MCGIVGFCDFGQKSNSNVLELMTQALFHRGPNDGGSKVWYNNAIVGFGHRRLSILDLSNNGHQPMLSLNEKYAIIFNGEVYNFSIIKTELEQKGYTFKSTSDTEVVLNAFIEWGVESVHKFIGMFSYSIYDIENNLIYIVRDRAGVKPLYYYFSDGLLLFGSELKSFHHHPSFKKNLDYNSVGNFLQYGYIPTPHTIFQNTFKVKPGHYLRVDLNRQEISEQTYWDLSDYYRHQSAISYPEALSSVEEILTSACNYRMVSDVPVGVFLSGGYDSSLVTALIQKEQTQKLKTFCIGFEDAQFNEALHARKVAAHLGTDHHEYYCTSKDLLDIVPSLSYIYDEPFGDSSAIPTILVSQLAQRSVSVVLSADAGDEIFAGYGKYATFLSIFRKYNNIPKPVKKVISAFLSTDIHKSFNRLNIYNLDTRVNKVQDLFKANGLGSYFKILSQFFTTKEIEALLNYKYQDNRTTYFDDSLIHESMGELNSLLLTDFRTFMLDDILTKVDRATMSVSIEGREPLLDHRISEYVAQLPAEYKLKNGVSKYILKDIAHKYIPKELLDRPKMGFSIPVNEWLRKDLKPMVLDYLNLDKVNNQGIFNVREFEAIRNEYVKNRNYNPHKIWYMLMFQMWYEKWME